MRSAARYIASRHDWWDPKPVQAVAYLTRLFEDPERTLCWFSDDQIAQGLTYLVGTSASGDNGWLSAIEVPVEARVRCVEAIGKLFDRLFARRCTPHLSHLSEVAAGRLNCVLYVVGRISMHRIAERPESATAKRYSLDDHGAHSRTGFAHVPGKCIPWAGHWQRQHATEVARIIDAFVSSQTELDPRLLAYANAARCGCIL
jgi:hypothetical protein